MCVNNRGVGLGSSAERLWYKEGMLSGDRGVSLSLEYFLMCEPGLLLFFEIIILKVKHNSPNLVP